MITLVKMLLKVLEQSKKEWDMTIYSDGRIGGFIGDTEFAFDPDCGDSEDFLAEMIVLVINEGDETEEEE